MRVSVRVIVSQDIDMEIDDKYATLADDYLHSIAMEDDCVDEITDLLYEKYPDIQLSRVVCVEDEDGNPLVEM